jgi:hypothetical protein
VFFEDARIRDECARRHLAAYSDVCEWLDDFEKEKEKAESGKVKFISCLKQKLVAVFGMELVQLRRKGKSASYVSENLPSLVYAKMLCKDTSANTRIEEDGKIWLDDVLIAKGKKIHFRVRKFVRDEVEDESNIEALGEILEAERKASEAQLRLAEGVRKLIMRTEAGEPLLGGCDTCPKVYIQKDASTK